MRPIPIPRRLYPFIIAGLVLVGIACLTVTFREDAWSSAGWRIPFTTDKDANTDKKPNEKPPDNGRTRIALMETGGTHDEVAAALLHAFGAMKDAELGIFFKAQRYEMPGIMEKFDLKTPIAFQKKAADFSVATRTWIPHIIVSTTCEFDTKNEAAPFRKLLHEDDAHLFCFIHHADRWFNNNRWASIAGEFHKKDRLDVVGLSAHTVEYFLNHSAPSWDGSRPISTRVLPPVFPVDLAAPDPEAPLSLAMQGDYSSSRRDYKGIFGALGDVIQAVRKHAEPSRRNPETVDLHVIGHGTPPPVPPGVRDRVFFDQSLSYPDFYGTLARAYSILPGFANDEYYDRKASSTVPAALIAGAPLVANEKLLAAYTYLPREATWVQGDDESEMDVIKRVITQRDDLAKRRAAMQAARVKLLKGNQESAVKWMGEARAKQKAARA